MATGTEHHSGTDSYRYIDTLIKGRGKELMIVSPYIGNYYVRMLTGKSRYKRIRMITSDGSLEYEGSMLKSLHSGAAGGYFKAVLYFAVLEAIVIYLRYFYITAVITLLLATFLLLSFVRARRASDRIKLKTTGREFVHEKIYIADDVAITGSANLTFAGTHKNLEHIQITRDAKEIGGLKRHFDSLWDRY